jgi:hypothetical protein
LRMSKYNKYYVCETCAVVFHISTPIKTRKPFCVNCGDNLDVIPYVSDASVKEKSEVRLPYTEKEMELINKCVAGEISPHQVAIMIGRSRSGIIKKVKRVREKLQNKEAVQ